MGKRQQSKRAKATCLSCKTTYDPVRYSGVCPTCARERMQQLYSAIRKGSR